VRFETIERVPFGALRERLAQADVVVDQVFMGWYGMVAVEAMALGKPVLCFIRDDFEPRLHHCPIVRCTKENLAERLEAVLDDEASRRALGERGRAYVEREHAAPVLAARLLDLYRSIVSAPESAHA
jgi:glycosyltransferase involved in cell wall biosynthesis